MTESTTATAHQQTRNKLKAIGRELPSVSAPGASYVPASRVGNIVYTSGQLPLRDGTLAAAGKVGAEISPEEAADLAALCVLNALAAAGIHGNLDKARIIKVVGFVASTPGFNGQPVVINGASNLLVDVFGDNGQHARSAIGVAELPLNAPVEVELVVEFS